MPQCPIGSQQAPGAPATFWIFDFQFLNWLSSKVPELYPLIALIFQPELISTVDFCASEPVIPVAPILTDYIAAFTPWGSLQKIVDYYRASYLSSIWPTYCQCRPGGQPAGSLEAYIATLGPANWWKYDEVAAAPAAIDSGTGHQNAAMFTPFAFNTPRIVPNAAGTCLTTSGGGGNVDNGGTTNIRGLQQFTIAGFFQTTDTSHGDLFSTYNNVNPFLRVGKDVLDGHLYAYVRDTSGTQTPVESANADFHNGATHLFVFTMDFVNHAWALISDNNRPECSGALTNLPYWDPSANLYLQDDFVQNHPYGGKSQDWFVLARIISAGEIANLWFNAGMGGGPAYTPVPPVIPPELPLVTGAPACSSIADLCLLVQQLNAKVNYLSLNTRPLSYLVGTSLTNLVGSGSIPGSSILGAIVDPTTVPASWGFTRETPPRWIPAVGSIHFQTADGQSNWRDIHYRTQQEFAQIPANVTGVEYSFRQGVRATVTLLLSPK
jgi:hypothetical protein